jgi:urate oxidase
MTSDGRETMSETTGGGRGEDGIFLGQTSYGKSGIRLVKVKRGAGRHELWDLNVDVALEGDFEAAHVNGDNSKLLATDTMRNTVYALAKDHLTASIEEFGLALVDHFIEAGPTVERASVTLTLFPWDRIEVDGRGHEHSFVRGAGERKALVTGDESGDRRIEAGLDNLLVMKTTASGWEDFFRDRFTTLPDAHDRILATVVTADWSYGSETDLDFDRLWSEVRDEIMTTFTDHYSPSVQNTLYRIGRAVLEARPEVEKIRLSFPNKHHIPYDLSPFGMENDNEIFWATNEPYGLIEGIVERER